MARLNLATRVERWWPKLARRDLDALPKGLSHELDLLVAQMGISREQFVAYKPSTREKYVRAARHGRTVAEERERVRGQRTSRKAAKAAREKAQDVRGDKLDRIMALRRKLLNEYGLDTSRGENTRVDRIEAEVLLSRQSIIEHISVYGVDDVLEKLEDMVAAVENQGIGERQWGVFAASTEDDVDERWFWYHSTPMIQPFGGYPGR